MGHELFELLAPFGALSLVLGSAVWHRGKSKRKLRAAARALGLEGPIREAAHHMEIRGDWEGRPVWVRADTWIRVGFDLPAALPEDLRVRPSTLARGSGAAGWPDQAFSARFVTRGDAGAQMALLSRPVRSFLTEALTQTGGGFAPEPMIEGGQFFLEYSPDRSAVGVPADLLKRAHALFPREPLSVPEGVLARLSDCEELEPVRLQALHWLLRSEDESVRSRARALAEASGLPGLACAASSPTTMAAQAGRLSLSAPSEAGRLSEASDELPPAGEA